MIHYHGGPITPSSCAVRAWKARHAFISYERPDQIVMASEISQSFALDNGAFSVWRSGRTPDWNKFYDFLAKWHNHPRFDFAVVPDVIEGSEEDNDQLASFFPFPKHKAAVVWHTNESVDRLIKLANEWPRVAIGSSGEYDASKPKKLVERLKDVLPAICTNEGYPICKLHGLRMLNARVFKHLPLSSADSTNVARNIGMDVNWKGTYQPASKDTRTMVLVERIEFENSACKLI